MEGRAAPWRFLAPDLPPRESPPLGFDWIMIAGSRRASLLDCLEPGFVRQPMAHLAEVDRLSFGFDWTIYMGSPRIHA